MAMEWSSVVVPVQVGTMCQYLSVRCCTDSTHPHLHLWLWTASGGLQRILLQARVIGSAVRAAYLSAVDACRLGDTKIGCQTDTWARRQLGAVAVVVHSLLSSDHRLVNRA